MTGSLARGRAGPVEAYVDILRLFRLDCDVAVVIGSGTGIGRAIALGLASAGADVVVAARREAMVASVADEIRSMGRRALAVRVDVTDEQQVQHVIEATLAEFGKIDIWVNNAGGLQGERPLVLRQYSPESFERILDLNFKSVWRAIA